MFGRQRIRDLERQLADAHRHIAELQREATDLDERNARLRGQLHGLRLDHGVQPAADGDPIDTAEQFGQTGLAFGFRSVTS